MFLRVLYVVPYHVCRACSVVPAVIHALALFVKPGAREANCVKISVRRMISREIYTMIPLSANTQFRAACMSDQ